jgi:hypothetical protein
MDFLLLLINTCWSVGLTLLAGWCLYPKGFVNHSKLIDAFLWLAIGHATLVLASILFVRLDYPGNLVLYVFPILLLYRGLQYLIPRHFYRISTLPEDWKIWPHSQSIKALLSIFALAMGLFYFPFLYKLTSGYYSISGGDLSIYLRMAEFFLDNGLNASLPERVELLPPVPNWNILTYIKSLQKGSGLFAGTLTSIPYMAISLTTVEEAYTISLFISYLLCIGGISALLGYLFGKGDRYIVAATITVALSNVLLWMAASHATPAFFVMGLAAPVVLLAIIGLQHGRPPILAIAVIIASMLYAYLPYFLIGTAIPVCFYLVYAIGQTLNKGWKVSGPYIFSLSFSLLAIAICVTGLVYLERDAILGMLGTDSFRGADFGLKGWTALLSVPGTIDFDMLFPHAFRVVKVWVFLSGIPVSLMLLIGVLTMIFYSNWILRSILCGQLLMLGFFALDRLSGSQTQYAGIRFAELASLYFAAGAGIGFLYLIINYQGNKFKKSLRVCIALCLASSLVLTGTVWARVLLWVPHEHSAMFDSDDIAMAASIQKIQTQTSEEEGRILYWFGSGPVSFAGTEVLFRHVRYFDAYDYDYYNYIKTHPWWRDVELDILRDSYLKNAIFAFPYSWRKEIISDSADFISAPTWEFGDNKVYDTTSSSGFTFLGDTWNPPIPLGGGAWGRYLKGRKGGLVVWSTHSHKLKLEITVFPTANNLGLKFEKRDGTLLKKIALGKERESKTFSFETLILPGMNTIMVSPEGLSEDKEWGLIQRKETPWIVFTDVNIGKVNLAR